MRDDPSQPEFPVIRVQLVRESSERREAISGPANAAEVAEHFLGLCDREQLIVLMLTAKSDLIGVHVASIGNLTSAIVSPREVFKAAILANACSIIVAHNHPSGDPEPSTEDHEVTKTLKEAGKLLGIPLDDHIIVGSQGRFVSFRRRGVL
ncbi:MAG: JAB domain-containing protein [Fimbriimonadaceae bacterium]|jgi:DNA repair protein RadC|nr:JAB domain-containing protein [Fimbriimonadaceae bacterium]